MVWSLRTLASVSALTMFGALPVGCTQSSSPSPAPSTSAGPTQGVRVGELATDFTLNDSDGRPVHLADYRGKVVLFEFSAMW